MILSDWFLCCFGYNLILIDEICASIATMAGVIYMSDLLNWCRTLPDHEIIHIITDTIVPPAVHLLLEDVRS